MPKRNYRNILLVAAAVAAFGAAAQAQDVPAEILALHKSMLVLDTHTDTPTASLSRLGFDFTKRTTYADSRTQLDLPRMDEGGLDGGFFVIYTDPGPLTPEGYATGLVSALRQEMSIRRLVAEHPDKLELAFTADDAARIVGAGKKAVYQSMENSYPLGEDLEMLGLFHKLGVRMAGPTHSRNSQFADSATDKPRWNGLSPLGRQWVAEMNRLGMIIDVSHSSDLAIDQMLALSKAPLIASHHGAKAVWDHPRNLDDARLKKIAAAGGVIQVNSIFLGESSRGSDPFKAAAEDVDLNALDRAEQAKALADMKADYEKYGLLEKTDFDTFMNQVLYILKLVGADHVGIGPDWDGGGGVKGMEDVAALPKVTARLQAAGYSDADIQKVWSGNLLRVMRQVEQVAAK